MKIKNWDAKLVGAWVYFLANNNHNLEHFLKALLEPFIENFPLYGILTQDRKYIYNKQNYKTRSITNQTYNT